MSTIRPLATIAILAGLGYFLATKINQSPVASTDELSANWGESPEFDVENAAPPTIDAPSFGAPPPSDSAPEFATPAPSSIVDAAPPLAPVSAPTSPSAMEKADSSSVPETPALPPLPEFPEVNTPSPPPPAMGTSPSANTTPPFGDKVSLPENIPQADYSGVADVPVATPSKESSISGQVPSLGTTTERPSDPVSLQSAPSTPPVYPSSAPENRYSPATQELPSTDSTSVAPQAAVVPPSMSPRFEAALGAIKTALQRDELTRAHTLLTQWYGDPALTPDQRVQVDQLLSQLAGTVVYSTEHRLAPPYAVQPGETLESIAEKHQVPWRLLAKINGVNRSTAIAPGQVLKVVQGPFSAVVDLSDNELALMVDDKYAGRFPVQLDGVVQAEGTWRVDQKSQEPTTGSRYALPSFGKKLVLKSAAGQTVVLEGPGALGAPLASMHKGRISVAATDLEDLHDILSVGSEVTIRR